MTNKNKQQQEVFEEYGVTSDEELDKILENDWKTIPCMGECGTPIFIERLNEYVWVNGDPYHRECMKNANSS